MPRSITIRDVPAETRRELAARAAATGRSLQEYLRAHLIELASRPEPEVVVPRLRARKESLGTRRLVRAPGPTQPSRTSRLWIIR